jgi:NAD(P)H-hydrate epimerase
VIPLPEVRVLDLNAEALGVPTAQLMENAGRALAEHCAPLAQQAGVLVLAGPGNNGGDGLVAARHLAAQRIAVEVVTPVSPGGWRTALARGAFGQLPPQVPVKFNATAADVERALARGPVVLDALLGAGLSGELREPYRGIVEVLSRTKARVVAVDVPTGFGGATTYVPRETVTFHDIKDGMSEATCGRVRVVDIGIPRDAARYTGPGEYLLYPQGRWEQHKGEGGIVLVIGGGPYTGAPAVCAMAALRAGADLAIVLTPQRAWQVVASYSPNVVVRPLNGDDLNFDDPANRVTLNTWLKKADSVVVGPGAGLFGQAQKAVHHALERAAREGLPVVVDADALTALAERKDLVGPRTVLTPHAREFRTLTGRDAPTDPDGREKAALGAARELGGTWLLKGPIDAIAEGERVKLNATGHPAMSVGGTGDALSGVVAALLAKGMAPFDAARVGARLTGEAGERAAAQRSWGLVATDVVEAIPAVLASVLPPAPRHP